MANCRAEGTLGQIVVDLKKAANIKESLYSLICMDNDLTENEDYFQEDTLELGYESEADRVVDEAIKELGLPRSAKKFKVVAEKVFDAISRQEYFGVCDLEVTSIGNSKVCVAYMYGGDYGV